MLHFSYTSVTGCQNQKMTNKKSIIKVWIVQYVPSFLELEQNRAKLVCYNLEIKITLFIILYLLLFSTYMQEIICKLPNQGKCTFVFHTNSSIKLMFLDWLRE